MACPQWLRGTPCLLRVGYFSQSWRLGEQLGESRWKLKSKEGVFHTSLAHAPLSSLQIDAEGIKLPTMETLRSKFGDVWMLLEP